MDENLVDHISKLLQENDMRDERSTQKVAQLVVDHVLEKAANFAFDKVLESADGHQPDMQDVLNDVADDMLDIKTIA